MEVVPLVYADTHIGASCGSDNDCSDELTCNAGKCSSGGGSAPPPPPPCSWEGHCEGKLKINPKTNTRLDLTNMILQGASCSDENDCADSLVCRSGKCSK